MAGSAPTSDLDTKHFNFLGQGFLSTRGELLGKLLDLSGPGAISSMNVHRQEGVYDFVDDRSSLAHHLSISAHAGFGFGGGSISAESSFVRDFRKSQRHLTVLMLKKVYHRSYVPVRETWRSEALEAFQKLGAHRFMQRYGDSYVSNVVTGGLCVIVYTLTFESMEEATTFRASFDVKSAAGGGGLRFHESLLRAAVHNQVAVQFSTTGVKDTPKTANGSGESGGNKDKMAATDKRAEELARYFDSFEEHVYEENLDVPMHTEEKSAFVADNAPGVPGDYDLSKVRRLLGRLAATRDKVDERLSQIDYMRTRAIKWNPAVKSGEIHQLATTFADLRQRVVEAADSLSRLPAADADERMAEFAVPELPVHWAITELINRQLVEVVLGVDPQVRAMPTQTRTQTLDIEPGLEGEPIQFEVEYFYNGMEGNPYRDASLRVILEAESEPPRPIFEMSYKRNDERGNFASQIFSYSKAMRRLVIDSRTTVALLKATISVKRMRE